MRCKRCSGGKEYQYTYFHERKLMYITYCRRCVSERTHFFQLCLYKQTIGKRYMFLRKHECVFTIPFPLTIEQKRAVFYLKGNVKRGKQLLLHAVCGAGKTEIVAAFIATALSQGKIIGWSIARRDVVIELTERLRQYFPKTSIIALYQSSPDLRKKGQFIVLTTARLFNYSHYFDYLIIDENDAYPYNISERQQYAATRAINNNGCIVHVSATILKKQKKSYYGIVSLAKRFHNEPLPQINFLKTDFNKIKRNKKISKDVIALISVYIQKSFPIFIFVSSKKRAKIVIDALKEKIHNEPIIYMASDVENRTRLLEDVREHKVRIVVTTTILERGVTFPNVQVIVMDADEAIFDAQTLIQIAGRVGRTFQNTTGEIIFCFSDFVTMSMKKAQKYHEQANRGKVIFL